MWERLGIPLNDRYQMALGLNSLLLRSQGKTVLIETGVGEKERPRAQSTPLAEGNLLDELRGGRRGARRRRRRHQHAPARRPLRLEHAQGRRTARASPTFPRARYLIQRGEWEAATHPNERTRATYLAENLLPLEEAGVLELIDGETRVTDEITIIPTHGHTADHASVVLASGGERAIYIGDMIQHPVQLERAPWVSSFDVYPLEAMETKKAVVARAIAERQLVVAVHCEFPGLGYMTETDDGKRKWIPVAASG